MPREWLEGDLTIRRWSLRGSAGPSMLLKENSPVLWSSSRRSKVKRGLYMQRRYRPRCSRKSRRVQIPSPAEKWQSVLSLCLPTSMTVKSHPRSPQQESLVWIAEASSTNQQRQHWPSARTSMILAPSLRDVLSLILAAVPSMSQSSRS